MRTHKYIRIPILIFGYRNWALKVISRSFQGQGVHGYLKNLSDRFTSPVRIPSMVSAQIEP